MKLRLLRVFLGLAAVTWGAALPGVFLSWETATSAMKGFGASEIAYDRRLDYWLRMASGAFGLIGLLYLLPTLQPRRFREFIPWLGLLALVEGGILLTHGLRLQLGPWPFYGDVAACLVAGSGILISWSILRKDLASSDVTNPHYQNLLNLPPEKNIHSLPNQVSPFSSDFRAFRGPSHSLRNQTLEKAHSMSQYRFTRKFTIV